LPEPTALAPEEKLFQPALAGWLLPLGGMRLLAKF